MSDTKIHPRLNHTFFPDDIRHFLTDLKYDDPNKQEVVKDILSWHFRYDVGLIDVQKNIIEEFEKAYPKAAIRLEPCDSCSYMVRIYGLVEKDKELAYEIALKIEKDILGSEYLLLISFVSPENTEKYYPEIWKEVLKKNS